MASTVTTRKALEKQGTGDNENTWGDVLNDVLDLLDTILGGYEAVNVGGSSNVTLTSAQYANPILSLTGTLTGNISVIVPTLEGWYLVANDTSGSFSITVKTSAGSGVVVSQGKKALVYCDGTNVVWGIHGSVLDGVEALIQGGAALNAGTTGGTGTAYTATLSPAITAYANKMLFVVTVEQAGGATPGRNYNTVGNKKMYRNIAGTITQVTTGDILANDIGLLLYDTALDSAAGGLHMLLPRGPVAMKDAANTFTATQTFADVLLGGAVQLSGDISPSEITSDQNDYAPTGHAAASTFRITTDASRNITGLAGGADGRVVFVHNVGSNPLVLKAESSSSSAANRFGFTGDLTLAAGTSALLQYDSTTQRWRQISTTKANSIAILEDQKSDGTVGGTASTGAWTKHAIGTEVTDPDGLVSVASDVITIGTAGTYEIMTEMVHGGITSGFRSRFRNTADNTTHALSTTGSGGGTSTYGENRMVTGRDVITITASKTFELQYFCAVTVGTTDLGLHDQVTAGVEIYARVTIRKLS